MRLRSSLGVLPLLGLVLACPGSAPDSGETGDTADRDSADTGPTFCGGEAPAVTLGTGESSYLTLADGSEQTMIYGPQGGWHFLGAVKLDNLAEIVALSFRGTWKATGEEVCYGYYRVLSICEDACDCSYWNMYCYIDVEDLASNPEGLPPYELLPDETVVLSVEVVDQDGREASDELEVVAVPDPANVDGEDTGSDTGTAGR